MTKPSIGLQDLRRRIYLKAKADQKWRFWGLYVHVCKPETLREAYEMARRNGGAAGIDGATFAAIEEAGLEAFLDDIHDELHSRTYRPSANRQVEIPRDGGKVRILGIPTIRDRVVQGALKLIRVRLLFVGGPTSLCGGGEAGGSWIRQRVVVVRKRRRGPVSDGTCAVSDRWGFSAGTRALRGRSQYASKRRLPVAP